MTLHHSEDIRGGIKLKKSVFHTKTHLESFALCCGLFKTAGADRSNEGESNTDSTLRAVLEEFNLVLCFFPQNLPSEAQLICNNFILLCWPLLPEGTAPDIALIKSIPLGIRLWRL